MQISGGNNPPRWPISGSSRGGEATGRRLAEGTGRREQWKREGVEKRWREAVEKLEAKEPGARNSPEKPKQSTKGGDRVSLLPGSGRKCCLSCERAVFGKKMAFSPARSRLGEGGGSAWLPACTYLPKPLRRSHSAPSSAEQRGSPSWGPIGDPATPNLCLAAVAPGSDPPRVPLLFQAVFRNFLRISSLFHCCLMINPPDMRHRHPESFGGARAQTGTS